MFLLPYSKTLDWKINENNYLWGKYTTNPTPQFFTAASGFVSFFLGLNPKSDVLNVFIFTVLYAYTLRPDSLMLGFPGHP